MSKPASIIHRLRRTQSGHSAMNRSLASLISCQPSGRSPCRRNSDAPHEEQKTRPLSPPARSPTRGSLLPSALGYLDPRELHAQLGFPAFIALFLSASPRVVKASARVGDVYLCE